MKAMICNGEGQILQVTEIPVPSPKKGEVLIKLKAAGINHRDWLIQKGQYVNLKYPIVLGSDGAGIIEKLGEEVSQYIPGEEVIINPGLNWGNDSRAPGKDFKILGLPDDGCFAEYVVVPSSAVHPKPKHLTFEEAAALPLSGLTGYRALFTRGNITEGQKVLITGIGGAVAQSMLQFALAVGAEVFFTSGSDEKIKRAVELGAKAGVNYKKEGWDEELLKLSGGFDLIIDSAAGAGFSKLIDLANSGGKIVTFGATNGTIPSLMIQRIYLKQIDISGSMMGSSKDFSDMLNLVNDKKIVPVIDEVFPLEQAEKAVRKMDTAAQFGKMVLKI
ncbi:zinc-binding dehydrogenase [Chryseobacterium sp.]|uniref:quinone oxidoreductase family protein n=1 Tax=Chryseobacterium sp. TaxID=1871047 RepID=UPI0025BDE864|nr:zinc-binding dehydrogenase [Chryseobacterium sp.]